MKLKRLKPGEMRVGMPLPWPVYFSNGDIAMDIGFIPDSEEQIESLMERSLCREPTALELKNEPQEHATLNLPEFKASAQQTEPPTPRGIPVPLEQVNPPVGEAFQLQLKSESNGDRYPVKLVGYLANEGVIVTTPIFDGRVMMFRENQVFIVRFFSGKTAYAFSAEVIKVTNMPFPHLHLAWPKEVRGLSVRNSARTQTNIICHASVAKETGFACIARDISMGGALIAAKNKIGEVGSKLILKMRAMVGETEHMLIIDCEIRSINHAKEEADENAMLHGVSFIKLDPQDQLVITALLYQSLMNEKSKR